jgi:hypothetical protein
MRHIVPSIALLLLLACKGADAQTSVASTWTCWHGGETSVYCLLNRAEPSGAATTPDAAGTARPLPAVVQTIRNDPASLEDRVIVIPLHSVPYDLAFVAQLAQAVMCGAKPDCAVVFGRSYAEALGRIMASR